MLPQFRLKKRGRCFREEAATAFRLVRINRTGLPLPGFLQLLYLAFDHLALERRGLVYEDDAVAVIRLVQHTASGQFHPIDFEEVSVHVVRADDCAKLSFDRKEDAGE